MPDEFFRMLASLVWAGLVAAILLMFRSDVRSILRHLVWRIKAGAPLKTAWFENQLPLRLA